MNRFMFCRDNSMLVLAQFTFLRKIKSYKIFLGECTASDFVRLQVNVASFQNFANDLKFGDYFKDDKISILKIILHGTVVHFDHAGKCRFRHRMD